MSAVCGAVGRVRAVNLARLRAQKAAGERRVKQGRGNERQRWPDMGPFESVEVEDWGRNDTMLPPLVNKELAPQRARLCKPRYLSQHCYTHCSWPASTVCASLAYFTELHSLNLLYTTFCNVHNIDHTAGKPTLLSLFSLP
eukprot:50018-Pyramimonas_sp.AAC.1